MQARTVEPHLRQSFTNNFLIKLQTFTQRELSRITREGGLDIHELAQLVTTPRDYSIDCPEDVDEVHIHNLDLVASDVEKHGDSLVQNNQVAFCILAGGAGTRIGKPKALLQLPNSDDTLLTHKLKQAKSFRDVWVVVSPDLSSLVKTHIRDKNLEKDGLRIVEQFESIRLDSVNDVVLDDAGRPCFYPTGHGDAIPALSHSGVLKEFLDRGGKHIFIVNVDNILADLDPRICGLHDANNHFVTCEVVRRLGDDVGGYLCQHNGVNQIVESFRMSPETDTKQFSLLSTNTMVVRADLPFDTITWSWHRVKKIIDNKVVIQYERLLQQLTERFKSEFVEARRSQRFQPVKNLDDLSNIKLK